MKRSKNVGSREPVGVRWTALVAVLVTLAGVDCNRNAATNGELADAKREWSQRLSALHARREALDAQIASAREWVGTGDSIAEEAARLRLQVAAAGQKQATFDLNGEVEAVAHEVETAKDQSEALVQARLRMAEQFAAQEENIGQTQRELTTIGRKTNHESEEAAAPTALANEGAK